MLRVREGNLRIKPILNPIHPSCCPFQSSLLVALSWHEDTTCTLSFVRLIILPKKNLPALVVQLIQMTKNIHRDLTTEGSNSPKKILQLNHSILRQMMKLRVKSYRKSFGTMGSSGKRRPALKKILENDNIAILRRRCQLPIINPQNIPSRYRN